MIVTPVHAICRQANRQTDKSDRQACHVNIQSVSVTRIAVTRMRLRVSAGNLFFGARDGFNNF